MAIVVVLLDFSKKMFSEEEIILKYTDIMKKKWRDFEKIVTDSSKSSIFTAEVCAIRETLLLIENCTRHKFLIISDNKSTLLAIQSFAKNNTHPLILRLSGKNIHFLWVPSYCGIDGNEVADSITTIS